MKIFIAIILGILFGALEATLWVFGIITNVRAMIPYATALAMLIFALTPILAIWIKNRSLLTECGAECVLRKLRLLAYVITIMIAATIFLIFVQVFVGTLLPFAFKVILAYIGSLSFWVMLIGFLMFLFNSITHRV